MKTIPFGVDKWIPYGEGFIFVEVKHGEVPLETEGRLPDWGGWVAGVAAAGGTSSGKVTWCEHGPWQRLWELGVRRREGRSLDSAWRMLSPGHFTLPVNLHIQELVLGLLRKLMKAMVSGSPAPTDTEVATQAPQNGDSKPVKQKNAFFLSKN